MARKNRNTQWRGRWAEARRDSQKRKNRRFERFIEQFNAAAQGETEAAGVQQREIRSRTEE